MSIQSNLNPQTSNPQQNWAVLYLESAKNRLSRAKGFWKRIRNESYIKLLFTYHPGAMGYQFFKSLGRIIKGIVLLFWAFFNKPTVTLPQVLAGVGLEVLALLINVFNVFFMWLPDIIRGVILGIVFNIISM